MAGESYFIADYSIGRTAAELTADFNGYGADGWQIADVMAKGPTNERAIFMAGAISTYLVVDYPMGSTPDQLKQAFDTYGADGWKLRLVDVVVQTRRRAIFMQSTDDGSGGGGGTFPEAPMDGRTYGRKDATWDWAISHTDDIVDGGNY